MKKIIVSLLALAFVSGCSSKGATFRTINEIKNSGKLIVNVAGQDGYYVIADGDNYSGVEIEIAEAVAKDLEVSVEYIRGFDAEGFMTAKVDLALGMLDPEAASLDVAQSKYTGSDGVFIISRYGEKYDTFSSMNDKTVGYVTGTAYENYIVGISSDVDNSAVFNEYNGVSQMVSGLLSGEIDAFVCIESEVDGILSQNEGKFIAVCSKEIPESNYSIIAMRGNNALIAYVDAAMDRINSGDDSNE